MQELTPAQHAVLEQLSRMHDSVQVRTVCDDGEDIVMMIPHAVCQQCNGSGTLADAAIVLVTTDGVTAPLGH